MDLNKNNMLEKKVDLLTKLICGHQDIAIKKKTLKSKNISTLPKSIRFLGVSGQLNDQTSMHTNPYKTNSFNNINTYKRQFIARYKTINQNNNSYKMLNNNKWSIPKLIAQDSPFTHLQKFRTNHALDPSVQYPNKYRNFSYKNAKSYYQLKNKVYRKYNIHSPCPNSTKYNQYTYNPNKCKNNFSCQKSIFKLNNKEFRTINNIQPKRAIKLSKYYVNRSKKLILNNSKINLQKTSKSKKAIYSLKRKDCLFFNRYGRCSKLPNCPYVHDPTHVAICTKFIRGSCVVANCPFSHQICKDKMPTCKYFLQGNCGKTDCKYSHIKLNSEAEVCRSFLNGYCKYGKECKKRHVLSCPEYAKSGKCQNSKCRLKHYYSKPKSTKFVDKEYCPINPLKLSKSRAQMLSEKIRRQSRTNLGDNGKPITPFNEEFKPASHEFNIANLPQIIPVPPLTPAEDLQLKHPWFIRAPITNPKIIAESRTLRIFPKFMQNDPEEL